MVSFPLLHLLCIGTLVVSMATVLNIVGFNSFYAMFEQCEEMAPKINALADLGTRCQDADFYKLAVELQAYLGMAFGMIGAGWAAGLQMSLLCHTTTTTAIYSVTTVSVAACFAAFGFTISATGVYADRLSSDNVIIIKDRTVVYYSFILCIASAMLFLIGAVLISISTKFFYGKGPRYRLEHGKVDSDTRKVDSDTLKKSKL